MNYSIEISIQTKNKIIKNKRKIKTLTFSLIGIFQRRIFIIFKINEFKCELISIDLEYKIDYFKEIICDIMKKLVKYSFENLHKYYIYNKKGNKIDIQGKNIRIK